MTAGQTHWGSKVTTSHVLGHPCRVFAQRPKHLRDLTEDTRRFPHRDYLVQGDRRISFADHQTAVAAVSMLLREHGVGPGDRVMLYGANSIEWVISFWAILHVGAIAVLGNGWWAKDELEHSIRVATPRLVITDATSRSMPEPPQRVLEVTKITAAIEAGAPVCSFAEPAAYEDDPAVIIFTSGTTGPPKGAVLSHRSVIATLQATLERTRRLPAPGAAPAPPSALLVSLPLFHVAGLQQIVIPLVSGGTLVFTEGRFDAARVVDLINTEPIKVWSCVPTMVSRVMDNLEDTGRPPLATIRTIAMGGAPVTEQLRARVPAFFPNAVRSLAVAYGMTESSGTIATGAGKDIRQRPGTVGRPLATVTVRIDKPDSTGAGEVLIQAPTVMLGYWQPSRPEPTIAGGIVTEDRWLHTGDVGRLDEDGYLYITDRLKEIVIRGGENIATPYVESRLLEHPAVREVAVIGLPHGSLGEELGAAVVLRDGLTADIDELRKFTAQTLAHFEVPTRWQFRTELPHNASGKILKRQLRLEWSDAETANPLP